MKKILFTIAIITILATVVVAFQGCSQQEAPGSAWPKKEVVSYTVWSGNGDDSVRFGTMVNTVEEVSGKQTIGEKEIALGETARGVKFTSVVTDLEGKVILRSETLVQKGSSSANLWISLAGYKTVDYNGKNYVLTTEYDGSKNLSYVKTKIDGSDKTEGVVNVGAGYVDGDFIYTYMRTYSGLSSGLSKSINTFDKDSLQAVTITSAKQGTGSGTINSDENTSESVAVVLQSFSLAGSPVGASIGVLYMKEKEFGKSKRIPMTISEGDITYKFYSYGE